MSATSIRADQAEWLIENGFVHTADVLLYWDDAAYIPLPEPEDCVVTRMAASGIFPVGPS